MFDLRERREEISNLVTRRITSQLRWNLSRQPNILIDMPLFDWTTFFWDPANITAKTTKVPMSRSVPCVPSNYHMESIHHKLVAVYPDLSKVIYFLYFFFDVLSSYFDDICSFGIDNRFLFLLETGIAMLIV